MKIEGFGKTLREWREAEGMSIARFAAQVGCDKGLLSKYENDKRPFTLERLDQFAKKLGREPEVILSRYLAKRYPRFRALIGTGE